ncbi:MAG: class I SAM-dependent methyltransferase [Gelidibacter sp.]
MNFLILNTDVQEFINNNLNSDVASLLLKGVSIEGVETKELIEQIEAKRRCQTKLPSWYNHPNIYYPNKLNIEQTSSEITAEYKTSLMKGKRIIDLTGGFGVDCFYFSKQFTEVEHCEINQELSEIVRYNFKQLDVETVETISSDGLEFLRNSNKTYDWIYVDPSRRNDSKGKVFFLKDCLPSIPNQLNMLFRHSNNIMIKTSPLLDITAGISELSNVKTIHVVAINNEVKELLWILEKDYQSKIMIKTINIKPETNETLEFYLDDETVETTNYSLPLTYLYEPNAAILKAGGFNSVSKQLNVYKLHKHTHLYTNENLIEFKGRRFKIENILPYHKKQLKRLGIQKANITTRNFTESVQQLRDTLKIRDGGNTYLFFTTNMHNEKVVLVCSKIFDA